MSDQLNLKQAERKLFSTSLRDGLLDIMISAFLLMFAVAPLLSTTLGDFWSSVVFLPFWGIVYLIVRLLRKMVVRPRLGQVKYGTARITKLNRFTRVMFVINLTFFIVGVLIAFLVPLGESGRMGWPVAIGFGLGLLLFSSLAGAYLNLSRLFVYGLLLAVAPVIGEWLYRQNWVAHHGYPVVFGTVSAVIFLVGVTMFIRLLREPYPPEENVLTGEA
jgi:MFS family permease